MAGHALRGNLESVDYKGMRALKSFYSEFHHITGVAFLDTTHIYNIKRKKPLRYLPFLFFEEYRLNLEAIPYSKQVVLVSTVVTHHTKAVSCIPVLIDLYTQSEVEGKTTGTARTALEHQSVTQV